MGTLLPRARDGNLRGRERGRSSAGRAFAVGGTLILVAGATGTLGVRLVRRLRDRGLGVRALTREPARAAQLADWGVELVRGDLRDAASVQRAARGATTVVGAAHGFLGRDRSSPATVDDLGNRHLVDAAREAGADVVLVSIVGAGPESAMELFRAKHAAEQYLWRSGVPATVVRATAFAETWIGILGEPLRATGRPLVFGRGRNPINFVAADTVAALLERVVLDRSLRSETIEIGGPENLTLADFAALLARHAGMSTEVRHVPRPVLRAMDLLLRPLRRPLAEQARAALVMDMRPMAFDVAPVRARFPDVPILGVRELLASGRVPVKQWPQRA